jgi:hypothetical protein
VYCIFSHTIASNEKDTAQLRFYALICRMLAN